VIEFSVRLDKGARPTRLIQADSHEPLLMAVPARDGGAMANLLGGARRGCCPQVARPPMLQRRRTDMVRGIYNGVILSVDILRDWSCHLHDSRGHVIRRCWEGGERDFQRRSRTITRAAW